MSCNKYLCRVLAQDGKMLGVSWSRNANLGFVKTELSRVAFPF